MSERSVGVDATALFRDQPTGVDRAARAWVAGLAHARPAWELTLAGWRGTDASARAHPLRLTAESHIKTAPVPRHGYRLAELARIPVPLDALSQASVDAWFFPDFARLPLLHRTPSLTVVHDLSYLGDVRFSAHLHRSYLDRQVRRALRLSTVAVVSTAIRDELTLHYGVPRNTVRVLPLAVDPLRFRPQADALVADLRTRLALDRPYVVAVGALHARKNVLRLIEAYSALGEAAHQTDLLLVGPTNHHSGDILAAVASYRGPGRVRHLGFVSEDDLPLVYAGADVAAVPSLYEGFGLPVLEAMACGTPALTSIGGALAEVGGHAVEYADPLDVASISAGLARLLGSAPLRAERREAGLQRAEVYSWSRSGELLAEFIEALR